MKIYLAIPYSHQSAEVRKQRFRLANKYAAKYMNQGHIVFSPISHNHSIIMQEDLPRGWEFWEKRDRAFIEWCDILFVIMEPGWKTSTGVQAEIDIATEMNKTVVYIDSSNEQEVS